MTPKLRNCQNLRRKRGIFVIVCGICRGVDKKQIYKWFLSWQEEVRPLQPLTHYLVCNNTQESIRFGQAGTEENLLLRPLEAHMYAWRTHKSSLQLWLCVEGLGYWRWCEPFSLSNDGQPQLRKIDHGTHVTTVVISIKKLAKSSQRQVSVPLSYPGFLGRFYCGNLLSNLRYTVTFFAPIT